MLLSQITHKKTLDSIKRYNISDTDLINITDHDQLKILFQRLSRRKWYHNHKHYWKERYIRNKDTQ